MRDEEVGPGGTFATWFRRARIDRGWTQDQLIDATDGEVSKSTLNRWENGKGIGELHKVRVAVVAMGADPREAATALGLVTREEWGLPPASTPVDPALREAVWLLADNRISEDAKTSLRNFLEGAVEFWRKQLGVRKPPREPSADERAKGKPVKGR